MNNEYVEREVTLEQLARAVNADTSVPDIIDIEELGAECMTPTGYQPITSLVVKEPTRGWQLGDLIASSNHRVLHGDKWTRVADVPGAVKLENDINVVDIEVPNWNCYNANGYVNHNTSPGG